VAIITEAAIGRNASPVVILRPDGPR
jgi:hypothetical protein